MVASAAIQAKVVRDQTLPLGARGRVVSRANNGSVEAVFCFKQNGGKWWSLTRHLHPQRGGNYVDRDGVVVAVNGDRVSSIAKSQPPFRQPRLRLVGEPHSSRRRNRGDEE